MPLDPSSFAMGEVPHRPVHHPLASKDVTLWRKKNWLGDSTPPELHSFVINLHCLLLDPTAKLPASDSFLKDEGLNETSFGNAGGGSWSGIYRQFQVQHKGVAHTVSISILAQAPSKTKPGPTVLLVGCASANTPAHSSLQLALDRFTDINGEEYTIWHNGALTNGRLGGAKHQDVNDFVAAEEPSLVQDNHIKLGTLSNTAQLSWEDHSTHAFIHNLVRYALLRDDFRKQART